MIHSKYFLLTCLLLALIPSQILCQDVKLEHLMAYNKWRFSNKRVYLNDDEQVYRQSVFFENLKKVSDHAQNKEATYKIGLNQFSDMTEEEINQRILNRVVAQLPNKETRNLQQYNWGSYYPYYPYYPNPNTNTNTNTNNPNTNTDTTTNTNNDPNNQFNKDTPIPANVDWRTKGVMVQPKNQGQCGSCWTFSTIGVLESFNAIKTGKLTTLSEQQLLDCVTQQGGYMAIGCQGGFPQDALRYAQKFGIVSSAQYPYTQAQGSCRVQQQTQGVFPKSFVQVPQTSDALKRALATAPVSVLVNASSWSYYSSGVFNGCGQTTQYQLNHAVVAVGYDAQGNWIIRNSYGSGWGESGYIRLAAGNTCGVLLSNYVVTE